MLHDLQVPFFRNALRMIFFGIIVELQLFVESLYLCSILYQQHFCTIWSFQQHWQYVYQIKKFHTILITSRCVNTCERWIIENLMDLMSLYQLAINSGVANVSLQDHGTLITIWFFANHQLSTDLICLYQKPFAFGLANSLMESSHHLGELITNYGFPEPLPQAITLWASQLFTIIDMVSWIPYNFWQIVI